MSTGDWIGLALFVIIGGGGWLALTVWMFGVIRDNHRNLPYD